MTNGFKFLMHVELAHAERLDLKFVVKSLPRFNLQLKVKESFKLLVAIKVKEHLAINHEIFWRQKHLLILVSRKVEYGLVN